MPDPAAKDPHSAKFDAAGVLWFTLQHSNMIGRLDPASGEITLVTPPTPDSRPYGIKIDKDGNPWVACNGSNCLLKVHPKSMAPTEVKLPGEGHKVRRLELADAGLIRTCNQPSGKRGPDRPAHRATTKGDP